MLFFFLKVMIESQNVNLNEAIFTSNVMLFLPTQVTTDIRQSCTHEHTGTSASAPIAAGIIALVLEAK